MELVDKQISTVEAEIVDLVLQVHYQTQTSSFMWNRIWNHGAADSADQCFQLLFSPELSFDVGVVQSSIFLDTLEETKKPAIALQALITTVLRNAYCDAVPYFDYRQEAVTCTVSLKQIPMDHTGLVVSAVLVALHFILTLVVVVLFGLRGNVLGLHNP